jgi:ATP-binding cassette, subfamily B, bacterial
MVDGGPGLLLRVGPEDLPRHQVKPGTLRRIIPYALRYRWSLVTLVVSPRSIRVLLSRPPCSWD